MPRGAIAAAVGALLLATAGGYWALSRTSGANSVASAQRVVTPTRRIVDTSVTATGTVRLRVGAEVRVGAQVSGIVEQLNVTVGSRVKQGDVLARIDARALGARLSQAEAQITVAERDVERARVEQARVAQLAKRQLVAASVAEDRQLSLNEALARLEKSRRDAAVVATDLRYTVIRAPITGTVASVATQRGETVASSFAAPTFMTIIGDNALHVIALVDETDIGGVAVGNAVSFTVESFPADEFVGKVESIAPKGTIISGVVNYEVMIMIDSPMAKLRPDMTANVMIRTAQREALVIPNEAIQRDGGERFVNIMDNGQAIRREVTIGARAGGFTEIRRGLSGTERVVIGDVANGSPGGERR
jgi:RND family efflux transporter MFP subunit